MTIQHEAEKGLVSLRRYQLGIFDCDGVVLDSNGLKSAAFRELAAPYGDAVAEQFVTYHRAHGGVSRFVKIRHLHEVLLGETVDESVLEEEIARYGRLVREGLTRCALVPGVGRFLERFRPGLGRFIVSGGWEPEIRDALSAHGMEGLFAGVFGAPRDKRTIVQSEIVARIEVPRDRVVYFGDSRLDAEVASQFGFDFIYVSGCAEGELGRNVNAVATIRDFDDLVGALDG